MTDPIRALCAELVRIADALNGGTPLISNQGQALDGYSALAAFRSVADRARVALAEQVTEPPAVAELPSKEELRDLWSWAAGQDQGPWPTQYHCFALAVLARWGRHAAPVPVPVSDRPWQREGWCDMDGECWWCPPDGPAYWSMVNPAMVYGGWLLPHWAIHQPPQGGEVG